MEQPKAQEPKPEEVILGEDGKPLSKKQLKKLQKAQEVEAKKAKRAEDSKEQAQKSGKKQEIPPHEYHQYRVDIVKDLKESKAPYPYPHKFHVSKSLPEFVEEFSKVEIAKGEQLTLDEQISVAGRVHNIRESGAKLIFYDIRGEGTKLQVLYSQDRANHDDQTFQNTVQLIKRGDIIGVKGFPARADKGELSICPSNI